MVERGMLLPNELPLPPLLLKPLFDGGVLGRWLSDPNEKVHSALCSLLLLLPKPEFCVVFPCREPPKLLLLSRRCGVLCGCSSYGRPCIVAFPKLALSFLSLLRRWFPNDGWLSLFLGCGVCTTRELLLL